MAYLVLKSSAVSLALSICSRRLELSTVATNTWAVKDKQCQEFLLAECWHRNNSFGEVWHFLSRIVSGIRTSEMQLRLTAGNDQLLQPPFPKIHQ